jgi:hypothetical protein
VLTASPPCLGQAGDSTLAGAPNPDPPGQGWIVAGNIRKSISSTSTSTSAESTADSGLFQKSQKQKKSKNQALSKTKLDQVVNPSVALVGDLGDADGGGNYEVTYKTNAQGTYNLEVEVTRPRPESYGGHPDTTPTSTETVPVVTSPDDNGRWTLEVEQAKNDPKYCFAYGACRAPPPARTHRPAAARAPLTGPPLCLCLRAFHPFY